MSAIPANQFCLAGATATGKSSVVQALAEKHGAAILSADAMLVYKGMDIGTAKPTEAERGRVPYYGLDCVTPEELFSTEAWIAQGVERWRVESPERSLFVTGGTGLYFSALLRGLEPSLPANESLRAELEQLTLEELQTRLPESVAPQIDRKNRRRLVRAIEIIESGHALPTAWEKQDKPRVFALTRERSALHRRIALRVEQMYAEGLLEETQQLLKDYPTWSRTATQAIGYAEAIGVLTGELTQAEAMEKTVIRTRQLAKRQETYLRHQFDVTWICAEDSDTLATLVSRVEAAWGI